MGVSNWVWLAAAWLLALAPAGPTFAATGETPAPGPVTMQVAAGLEGYVDPSTPLRVTVEISASSLTVGRLELQFGGSVSTAVEVPAGSVKRYELEGPVPLNRRQATVRLVAEDGTEIATEALRLRVADDETLVGLLGVDTIETAVRSATTTPLGRAVTALLVSAKDAASMAPLAYVIVGPGALADAEPAELAAIADWVDSGGRLYGAAADIAPVGEVGSGTVYAGTDLVVTRVGAGEIGVVPDPTDLGQDEWSAILRDRPSSAAIVDQGRTEATLALVSAASAGREASVPALPWLLAGIALFVLLVGPVNFLVLRSIGKPEWAWLTIPALSAVFLAGFWLIGRSQLADFEATHAALLIDRGDATEARAGVVVQVESAGEHVLAAPDGWQPIPSASGSTGSGVVEDDRVVFDLPDLGVGTIELTWQEQSLPLTATVSSAGAGDSDVEVEVVNDTPWTLWGWGVAMNGVAYNGEGTLDPGARGTVAVRSTLLRPAYEPVISEAISRRPYDADFPIPTYEVVYPLAALAEQEAPSLRDRDAYVFGFTADRTLALSLDGHASAAAGTTLLLRRFPVPATTASIGGVRPEVLSIVGASSIERYGDDVYAYGAEEVYLHYEVPVAAPERAEINPSFTQLDVVAVYDWSAGEFVPFAWGETFTVADVASPSGEVVIRAGRDGDSEFFDDSISLTRFAMRWSEA